MTLKKTEQYKVPTHEGQFSRFTMLGFLGENQKTVSYLFLGEADRKHARNMMNVIDVIDLAI